MMNYWIFIKKNKAAGGSRWDFLEMAAEVEGIYIPSFYDVAYKEDGTILSFTPNNVHAKENIKKQVVMDMSRCAISGKTGCTFY